MVKVGRRTTLSVPFVVIPTKEGEYPIEVKAEMKDSMLTDGIRKMLQVVVRKHSHLSESTKLVVDDVMSFLGFFPPFLA